MLSIFDFLFVKQIILVLGIFSIGSLPAYLSDYNYYILPMLGLFEILYINLSL